MHLRIYNEHTDFVHIASWITDERIHAFWSADTLPWPLSEEGLHNYLVGQNLKFHTQLQDEISGNEKEYDGAYVYADEYDRPLGFFVYTVNEQDKSGFVRFIVVDNTSRGKGYGSDMLKKLLRFAYENTGVLSVRLNVFDVNTAAMRCYRKVGFAPADNTPTEFTYQDEIWKRCLMEHRRA